MKKIISILLCNFCLVSIFAAVSPPSGLKAVVLSSTEIQLTWVNNDAEATVLQLEQSMNGINYSIVDNQLAATTTSYTDSSLGVGVVYGYRLCAKKGSEVSEYVYSEILATLEEPLLPNIASIPGSKVTVQYENNNTPSERSPYVIDDDITTKYLFGNRSGWIKIELPKPYTAKGYAIVSANDGVERDPKNWTLQASNNTNGPWETLDTRQNQYFISRFAPVRFNISTDEEYKFYRLNITSNNTGGGLTQLADLKIFAERDIEDIMGEEVAAPTNVRATVNAHHIATIRWNDNANNEDTYVVQRSTDGTNWDWEKRFGKNYTRIYSTQLQGATTYHYRVRAENAYKQSEWTTLASPITTPAVEVPETIKEDWGDHDKLTLTRKFYDHRVAIYYDDDMDQTITWPFQFFGDSWDYFKEVYGDYSDPMLYVYFHADQYSGGHPATWGSPSHHFRNAIDNGSGAPGYRSWQTIEDGWGIPIHEISHIVEGGSHHMQGSPEAGCWGDSKFAEIFTYDYTLAMAKIEGDPYRMKALSKWMYDFLLDHADSSVPREGCYWFRDFYYPIYSQFGGSAMLSDFFKLMYEYWPKKDLTYVGGMNYGEFFHFYSGACGVDIREYADRAFTWTTEWEYQFKQAQRVYPFTYDAAPATITQNGGEIISEYSIKDNDPMSDPAMLIDKNIRSKYRRLSIGANSYWVQYNSPVPYTLFGYNLTTGDDYPTYDPKSWTLSGSNDDGQTWEIIDTQTDFMFLTRSMTNYFEVNTDKAYKSFRLNITAMAGEDAKTVQLAEWQLLGYESPDSPGTGLQQPKTNDNLDVNAPINGKLTVYDITGKTVVSRYCTEDSWNDLVLSFNLPRGTYVCTVADSSTLIKRKKLIVN